LNHFYGIESADLTLPEFLAALNSLGYVQQELRPKNPTEIMALIAKQVGETFERNRQARAAAAEANEGDLWPTTI
jgi:hypothetical protein